MTPETKRDSKLRRGSSLICQRKHMLEIRELRSNALGSKFLAFHPNRFRSFFIVSVRNKRAKRQISNLNSVSRLEKLRAESFPPGRSMDQTNQRHLR